jgi:hypothetical protein
MSDKIYVCPHDKTQVTKQFVSDPSDRIARAWRCEEGHFFGAFHWSEDWEDPCTEPPDPDLELWPGQLSDQKGVVISSPEAPRLEPEPKQKLSCGEFLIRAVPSLLLAALSILVVATLLMAPTSGPSRAMLTVLIELFEKAA